jgi:hypothetical protein
MMGDALANLYTRTRCGSSAAGCAVRIRSWTTRASDTTASPTTPWLVPQLGLDPVAGDIGTVNTMAQQNAWLKRFFDRQMRG